MVNYLWEFTNNTWTPTSEVGLLTSCIFRSPPYRNNQAQYTKPITYLIIIQGINKINKSPSFSFITKSHFGYILKKTQSQNVYVSQDSLQSLLARRQKITSNKIIENYKKDSQWWNHFHSFMYVRATLVKGPY